MIIEYTGRQTSVTQKYKAQAEVGLSRIEKLVSGAATAKVVLTADKYRRIADVTVIQGDRSIVAACESAEMMTALRDALAKIEAQALKQRKRAAAIARRPKAEMMVPIPEAAAS
ncbi:MAG TPA: HPF/RaiA family ribosome-associated protein [Acidobacteriaceae bacterium]|jgi:putative sigma-54 modulation protein|nr:HPF/RaiA family ribosome-associated protein [Acidobacteriaceae bacterium]